MNNNYNTNFKFQQPDIFQIQLFRIKNIKFKNKVHKNPPAFQKRGFYFPIKRNHTHKATRQS